ncbi:unnamed protein product [Protopolystoma xenopodis]|uniref:Formimidoylglutamase n=1 Tax=Protopolystoma xenopodis TaxID=117903 RepID=A0A448WW57_9PLAT|nr:unnamed protein product [Protopolystoma xenopodis]
MEMIHQRHRSLVSQCLSEGHLPVCLGGGNDQSWPNGAAWIEHWRQCSRDSTCRFGVINVDAHLDVRPLCSEGGHSGSPFRQLIEFSRPEEASYFLNY